MTQDDIIRMAREAGFKVGDNLSGITLVGAPNQIGLSHLTVDELAIFAALVAAAEREAIGNIILDYAGRDDLSDSDESLLKHLFELIRARGEA